jgi:hypothetical protein
LALGEFHGGDSRDALRSNCAGLDLFRVKTTQDKLFDLVADLGIEAKPAGRVLDLTRAVL